jgi:hypothetical protein
MTNPQTPSQKPAGFPRRGFLLAERSPRGGALDAIGVTPAGIAALDCAPAWREEGDLETFRELTGRT